jgi:hypothetical protein
MIDLLVGALALILLLILLHGFTRADPRALAKTVCYTGALALVVAAAFFLVRGIVPAAMVLGSMAYGVFTGGRIWPGGWPHWHFPSTGGGPRPNSGQTTRVSTDWIAMELDHDTGAMRGQVLKGKHSGKALDSLSDEEALALYREVGGADPETSRLLEVYLDRRLAADWRSKSANGESSSKKSRADSGMTRKEAYRVLGLKTDASEDEIRAAHRKLMLNIHPDRGGSDYLAAKINEAKDVLLS